MLLMHMLQQDKARRRVFLLNRNLAAAHLPWGVWVYSHNTSPSCGGIYTYMWKVRTYMPQPGRYVYMSPFTHAYGLKA